MESIQKDLRQEISDYVGSVVNQDTEVIRLVELRRAVTTNFNDKYQKLNPNSRGISFSGIVECELQSIMSGKGYDLMSGSGLHCLRDMGEIKGEIDINYVVNIYLYSRYLPPTPEKFFLKF